MSDNYVEVYFTNDSHGRDISNGHLDESDSAVDEHTLTGPCSHCGRLYYPGDYVRMYRIFEEYTQILFDGCWLCWQEFYS